MAKRRSPKSSIARSAAGACAGLSPSHAAEAIARLRQPIHPIFQTEPGAIAQIEGAEQFPVGASSAGPGANGLGSGPNAVRPYVAGPGFSSPGSDPNAAGSGPNAVRPYGQDQSSEPASGNASAQFMSIDPVCWRDAIPVLPYQFHWIRDDSQLKIAVWSRQSGKSFAAALRAVLKCLEKRTQYIILSKGERQSRLFMEKVKDFCRVFKELRMLPEYAAAEETDDKTMEVFFPHNHSRIIGLPANPDTARGYTGHIVLDEFAFHGDAHKIYAACFPIITRGYSIEVISTPNGTAGKFYEIAKAAGLVGEVSGARCPVPEKEVPGIRCQVPGEKPLPDSLTPDTRHLTPALWSGHKVDIYSAVEQGLPAKIDLLRSGCDDEETWLQEYCCQFLSDAQNYIPLELISCCVHEEATTEWENESVVRCHAVAERASGRPETGRRALFGSGHWPQTRSDRRLAV